ncbi:MAG: peptidoglycan-binding domain-containing protein, partial [bacterium]
ENTGWIDFAGVTIGSDGYFSGYASGTVTGQINMNCSNTASCVSSDFKLRTDWRPSASRAACNNSSDDDGDGLSDYPDDPGCSSLTDTDETDPTSAVAILPPVVYNKPIPPKQGFSILIDGGAKQTNGQQVNLVLNAGLDTTKMAISNSVAFNLSSQEPYSKTRKWNLCDDPLNCKEGKYDVYVKFYTQYGQASSIVSANIEYKKDSSNTIVDSTQGTVPTFPPTLTTPPTSECTRHTFTKSLQIGSKNSEVKELQKYLNNNGFVISNSGPGSKNHETDFFGDLTRQTLIKFQDYHADKILKPAGLSKGTGYFGLSTIKFINTNKDCQKEVLTLPEEPTKQTVKLVPVSKYVFTRYLYIDDSGEEVKQLQLKLKELGYFTYPTATGYFGLVTKEAVIKFQKAKNLVPYPGWVGPQTRKALNAD